MTLETHWNCPVCGQIYRLDEPACAVCHITREKRDVIGKVSVVRPIEKPAEAVQVTLPYVIKEASFNLTMPDGAKLWASGWLAAGETGFFLVGAKDGLDPKEIARTRPAGRGFLGPASMFVPASEVRRVVHERLIGFWIELTDGKIPLRLPKDAWAELDALCDHHGIRHT
jgi:hypothetical protein